MNQLAHTFSAIVALLAPRVVAEPAPQPSIVLSIAEQSSHVWRMRVENTGEVPVRLVADARLLSFDVTAPGGKKPLYCALPAEMRPPTDDGRGLVVPPKRAYVEAFDPRMYCFGANEHAALVPGATAVAHLGWPAKRPARRSDTVMPFEVAPIEGVTPRIAPATEIVSASFTLAGAPESPPPPPSSDDSDAPLALSSSPSADARRGRDVTIDVTLTNRSAHSVDVFLRPEALAFDVLGPEGPIRCSGVHLVGVIRELFTTVPARGRASLDVLVSAICPEGTFDRPGIYSVRAQLDTRHASGRKVGLSTFDGVLYAPEATRLRVRTATKEVPRARPMLE